MVSGDSQALDCDLCGRWFHHTCINISKQAYKIYSQFEGQLPWFCTSCLASLKSLHSSLDKLTLENHALKLELAQLRSLDSLVTTLSHEVSRLSGDLAFLTRPDSTSLNPASTTHACQLPQPITPHLNPFECLSDSNPDMPVVHGKGNPDTDSSPTPLASTSKPRKSPKRPQPQPTTVGPPKRNPSMQGLKKFYIRAIPSHTSIQEVKCKLQSLSIPHDHLSEPHFTTPDPKRKYFEILLNIDNANKLDKVLKGDTALTWFVSIFPPKRPHPVPLMSLKLPPLPVGYANDCPIPLMSLKLPPLPETYTSGQYSQKSHSQATQDFLGRGRIPLIVR